MRAICPNNETGQMTQNQYRAAIAKLGLSQCGAARFLDIDERTSRRYALGQAAIPESVAKLLRLMIDRGVKPDEMP